MAMNHSDPFGAGAAGAPLPAGEGLAICVSSGGSKLSMSDLSPSRAPKGELGLRLRGEDPNTTGGLDPPEEEGGGGLEGPFVSENIESSASPISSSIPAGAWIPAGASIPAGACMPAGAWAASGSAEEGGSDCGETGTESASTM